MSLIGANIPVHIDNGGEPRCRSGNPGRGGRVATFRKTEDPVTCRKCILMEQGKWVPSPNGRRGA